MVPSGDQFDLLGEIALPATAVGVDMAVRETEDSNAASHGDAVELRSGMFARIASPICQASGSAIAAGLERGLQVSPGLGRDGDAGGQRVLLGANHFEVHGTGVTALVQGADVAD